MARKMLRAAAQLLALLVVIAVAFVAGRWTAAGPGIYVCRGRAPWVEVHHAGTGELMGEYRPRDGAWWQVLDDLLREHEGRPVYPPVPAHLVGTPEPGCGPNMPEPQNAPQTRQEPPGAPKRAPGG